MRRPISLLVASFFFASIFLCFFNGGYGSRGPSRQKFRRLGESTEEITEIEQVKRTDHLADIRTDKRLIAWEAWWKRCEPRFSLATLEEIVRVTLDDEMLPPLPEGESRKGVGKIFYQRAPGGKHYLNPYWGRLRYTKVPDGWQPRIEVSCGALLETPAKKTRQVILRCTATDGIDGAFWIDKNRAAIMGYETVSLPGDEECGEEEGCIAPTVWVADISTGFLTQYRGLAFDRTKCRLSDYLKKSLPKFFGEK